MKCLCVLHILCNTLHLVNTETNVEWVNKSMTSFQMRRFPVVTGLGLRSSENSSLQDPESMFK